MGWLVGTVLLIAAALAARRVFGGYERRGHQTLAPRESGFIEAAALAMFPPGGALEPSGLDADVPGYVDGYVAQVPARIRLLMRALFALFEHATLVFPAPGRGGRRRFSVLSVEQRRAVLASWEESRSYPRRVAFTSLRAILTLGYLAHPAVLRELKLAPFAFETPVCEADLLLPRIGARPEDIPLTRDDLTPASDGTPLALDGPLHPDYRESA